MARSAALGLTLGGVGAVAIISGIQGKSIGQVLKGDIGTPPEPGFKPKQEMEESGPESTSATAFTSFNEGALGATGSGLISPFPKGSIIQWGRSDQGVDGVTAPGTPLRAMGNGTVSIAHNPSGFGSNYVVLHITGDGSYYYGHAEPLVSAGPVKQGQVIARTHKAPSWGNSTTPGGFEIGKLGPHGEYPSFATGGAEIRSFLQHLPML